MKNILKQPGKGESMEVLIEGEAPAEVIERLQILLSTPKGTVCYDRKFGVDISVLDLPLPIARVKYLAQCTEAIRRYEPQITIKDVILKSNNALKGQMQIKVVVSYGG